MIRHRIHRPFAALLAALAAGLLASLGFASVAAAQQVYTLKMSHFIPPVHQQHKTFVEWGQELEKRSNGRLKLEIFPAQQMGPVPEQYNLARRGDADISFVLHGIPAGRFPLIELTHLPFLFESAEQANQVLMDLVPEYLAEEHRGVRILYLLAHAPGHIHTRDKPVRSVADMNGLRIRHPSSVVGEILAALGAAPKGLPPGQIAENLDKGVIDGLVMPYDGVLGFRLGPHVKYTTELHGYINTFATVMNPASYNRLPKDLQRIIDDTSGMAAARLAGKRWDAVEGPGRQYMVDNKVTPIKLSPAELAAFAQAAEPVVEARLKATEEKGLPARAYFAKLKELAKKYR